MKCPKQTQEGQELLLAFSSRVLDAERAADVETHVRECSGCEELVAAQREVSKLLDAWAAPAVSADFDRRLYARIEQEVAWWDFLMRPFRGLFAPRWAPVALSAAVLIAIGVWVERPGVRPAAPATARIEALPPEQAADVLQEMQVMQEFSNLIHADSEPQM